MSKYNRYANELGEKFKELRADFGKAVEAEAKAHAAYKAAVEALNAPQRYQGENEHRMKTAKADWIEAENRLRAEAYRFSNEYTRHASSVRKELEERLNKDNALNPDDVDQNAVRLLDGGIANPSDLVSMMEKYDENPTMLRMIRQYAKQQAAKCQDAGDFTGKSSFSIVEQKAVYMDTPAVLEVFDNITTAGYYCTGQNDKSHAQAICSRFEEFVGPAIENF